MRTSFIILGSGQDGGSPQVGRRSSVSAPRCASSVAIVGPKGAVVLLDASPDLRTQSQTLLHSNVYPGNRESLVDGVCITHAHMGHYAGLLHFGKEAACETGLPLFGTERFLAYMEANDPWAELLQDGHLDPIRIDGVKAGIDESLAISAIPVPHRDEYSDTVAFSVTVDDQPWLLYLPDIDDWQLWDRAELEIARHEVALLDATFSSINELQGRDIADIRHPLVPDTIERFQHLAHDTQMILTHINHSNSLGEPGAEVTGQATSAGFIVAYDGLTMSRDG